MDKVLEIGNFFIKLNDHAKNIDTQIQNGLPFLHFLNKNKKKTSLKNTASINNNVIIIIMLIIM